MNPRVCLLNMLLPGDEVIVDPQEKVCRIKINQHTITLQKDRVNEDYEKSFLQDLLPHFIHILARGVE